MNGPGRKRRIFRSLTAPEKALSQFLEAWVSRGGESLPPVLVDLEKAAGCYTAEAIFAASDAPHYDGSAMDGIAVAATSTLGANPRTPVKLEAGQYHWVDTGDPIPREFDAVVKVEDLAQEEGGRVLVNSPVRPGQHVRNSGEDIPKGRMVVPARHRLSPADLAALAAAGVYRVLVSPSPRVALLPLGDELVSIDDLRRAGRGPLEGEIPEFNSILLAGLLAETGAEPVIRPVTPDDRKALERALEEAREEADVVVTVAGSSAGRGDFVAPVLSRLGELVLHGVAMRPGHPLILGFLDRTPCIGLPGYPVAAVLGLRSFVLPLVQALMGLEARKGTQMEAVLARRLLSSAGVEEYVRVRLGRVGSRLVAHPLERGAANVGSLARADGFACVPIGVEELDEGAGVKVEVLKPLDEIEANLITLGSEDPQTDLISDRLRQGHPPLKLAFIRSGTIAGLKILSRGGAHLVVAHLPDPEAGEGNLSQIKELAGQGARVFLLASREQGLILPRGNPDDITGLADLAGGGPGGTGTRLFVNREPGSATRRLLEVCLDREGIDARTINGFENWRSSHSNVARAVARGHATAGFGIRSAAEAFGLCFLPAVRERVYLVAGAGMGEREVRRLQETLQSPELKEAVGRLTGYDTGGLGKEVS